MPTLKESKRIEELHALPMVATPLRIATAKCLRSICSAA